jgi:trehalose synthase
MHSVEENALMVNALQRTSTIVVQNSLREGRGLTIAEAMWKRIPVLINSRACGPRQQVLAQLRSWGQLLGAAVELRSAHE